MENPEIITETPKIESYLNFHIAFHPEFTTKEKEKAIQRVSAKLHILFEYQLYRLWLEEHQYFEVSCALSKKYQNRMFNEIKFAKCKIHCSISEKSEYDPVCILDGILFKLNPDQSEVEIEEVSEEMVINDLTILSKEVCYEKPELIKLAKESLSKAKISNYIFEIPPIANLNNEDITTYVSHLISLISLEKAIEEPIINLKGWDLVTFVRFLFNPEIFGKVIYLEGLLASEPSLEYIRSEKEKDSKVHISQNYRFIVEDINGKRILINSKNLPYDFLHLLSVRTKVKVSGILALNNKTPTLELIGIEIVEKGLISVTYPRFKIAKKIEYSYENDENGIYVRGINRDSHEVEYECKLTEKPIILSRVFKDSEDSDLYEVTLGSQTYFGTFKEIIEQIKDGSHNLLVCEDDFPNAFSNLTREIARVKKLIPEKVHCWVGIHSDDNNNLELAIPQLCKIIPRNFSQKEVASQIENAKIIIPKINEVYTPEERVEIDSILNSWVKLMRFRHIPNVFKLVAFGYNVISPFFKSISKTKKLDVFPVYFAIGVRNSGKTSFLRLFPEDLFGIDIIGGDKINSASRLKDILSSSTLPQFVDEIDIISKNPSVILFLKAVLTSMMSTGRKKSDQEWELTDMNCTVMGSANSIEWLEMDNAFKEGRALLTHHNKRVNANFSSEFEEIANHLKNSRKIGYYVLNEAIKFFQGYKTTINATSDLEAIMSYINEKRKHVRDICTEYGITLSDSRRYTINALILVGLEIWKFVFMKSDKLDCDFLIKFTEPKSKEFADFLKDFEEQCKNQKLEDIYSIVQFIDHKYSFRSNDFIKVDHKAQIIWLSNGFLADYNSYARTSGLKLYNNLPDIASILTRVIPDRDCSESKLIRMKKGGSQTRCIPFYYQETFKETIPITQEANLDGCIEESSPYQEVMEIAKVEKPSRNIELEILTHIKNLFASNKALKFEDIMEPLVTKDISEDNLRKVLDSLIDKNRIRFSEGSFTRIEKN